MNVQRGGKRNGRKTLSLMNLVCACETANECVLELSLAMYVLPIFSSFYEFSSKSCLGKYCLFVCFFLIFLYNVNIKYGGKKSRQKNVVLRVWIIWSLLSVYCFYWHPMLQMKMTSTHLFFGSRFICAVHALEINTMDLYDPKIYYIPTWFSSEKFLKYFMVVSDFYSRTKSILSTTYSSVHFSHRQNAKKIKRMSVELVGPWRAVNRSKQGGRTRITQ